MRIVRLPKLNSLCVYIRYNSNMVTCFMLSQRTSIHSYVRTFLDHPVLRVTHVVWKVVSWLNCQCLLVALRRSKFDFRLPRHVAWPLCSLSCSLTPSCHARK